jgi:hypothetical protein
MWKDILVKIASSLIASAVITAIGKLKNIITQKKDRKKSVKE